MAGRGELNNALRGDEIPRPARAEGEIENERNWKMTARSFYQITELNSHKEIEQLME